jgi:hypothetical protein
VLQIFHKKPDAAKTIKNSWSYSKCHLLKPNLKTSVILTPPNATRFTRRIEAVINRGLNCLKALKLALFRQNHND